MLRKSIAIFSKARHAFDEINELVSDAAGRAGVPIERGIDLPAVPPASRSNPGRAAREWPLSGEGSF
jgi:hypothetical protein